jgi:hypothetical protein
MTIGEIKQRIIPMLEDTNFAERALEVDDSQFARRGYVRSVFAMIEGTLWVLKQTILDAPAMPGTVKNLSVADYALLTEKTYDLKSNGKPREQPKFLRLPDNLRFTFGVIAKYFGPGPDLGVGTQAWDNFLASHSLRNRITHPKDPSAFEISKDEIATCKRTTAWFYKLVLQVFDCFTQVC